MSLLLAHANLLGPEPLGPGSVLIEGARIAAVYRIGEVLPDVETLDLGGAVLGPGWIDLHTHGADRVDLMDGGDVVQRMARFFAAHGVTAFVPATVTASWDDIERTVAQVRRAVAIRTGGARVLGVHLEGPFLNPQRLGAQSPDFSLQPTPEHVNHLLDIAGDVARIVTLAPEVEGGQEAIPLFIRRGVRVGIGHSVASDAQAQRAFERGARYVTHLFNGMPPMHHREPGLVGAALATSQVTVEIIADGIHLAPTTVRLAVAAKGVDEVVLVTDSMAATGCPDGEYSLGPIKVIVREGQARLPAGNLAGSTLTLNRAVLNAARWTSVGLHGAWQMASLNPARYLELDDHRGRVAQGYDADLTAIDASGQVVMTMVNGEIVYRNLRVP